MDSKNGASIHTIIPDFDPTATGNRSYTIGTYYKLFDQNVLSVSAPVTGNYTTYGYVLIHLPISEIAKSQSHILDILYMTRVQKERFLDEEEFNRVKDSFVLDPSKLRTAKSDMIVLHPLPRVNEITRAVDNDPRAAYFRQVENGKFVRMALIYTLLKWAEGEKLAAVPDLAEGMFIDRSMKCPNSRCISATEDVDPLFVKAGDTCRCAYCEAKIR